MKLLAALLVLAVAGCISAPAPAGPSTLATSGSWSMQDPMCATPGYGTWESEPLNATAFNLSGSATCIPAGGGIVNEAVNENAFPMVGWCIEPNPYEAGCWDAQGVVWYNQTNLVFGYRVNFTRT